MTDNEIISQASKKQLNAACEKTDTSKNILSDASFIKGWNEKVDRIKNTVGGGCSVHVFSEDLFKLIDLLNRQQAEIERKHKIVCDYAQAARTIELYLKDFCDKKLPYDEMIADASRKASAEIERYKQNEKFISAKCDDVQLKLDKLDQQILEAVIPVKTEAIKEFAERLKCNASILCDKVTGLPCSYTISNYNFNRLLKEMTEQKG